MGLALSELGGGAKAWSAENMGDKIVGKITLVERRQQRSLDEKGKLETWDDGSPRMLTYIELQTDEHIDDDDDGIRSLYAKGGRNHEAAQGSGTSMEVAIAEAVKAAGCNSIDEGATLAVQHTGVAKVAIRGHNPAKLYKAQYKAPVSSVNADDLFSN
jgi:hypothetical protein